ncbi:MAG: hypothetical protein AB7Q81_19220 [Gammaproteobacteria bacterium]
MRAGRCVLAIVLGLPLAVSAADEAATVAACARAHRLEQTIDLSGGVYTERAVAAAPLSVTIPAGVDDSGFAACLEQHGVDRAAPVEAWARRVEDCRGAHPPASRVSIGPGGAQRIGAGESDGAYEDCLDGRLEVEVTLPAR